MTKCPSKPLGKIISVDPSSTDGFNEWPIHQHIVLLADPGLHDVMKEYLWDGDKFVLIRSQEQSGAEWKINFQKQAQS